MALTSRQRWQWRGSIDDDYSSDIAISRHAVTSDTPYPSPRHIACDTSHGQSLHRHAITITITIA